MTPQRWAQIRQLFEGALERSPKDRAAYLRVLCARDDELRREVDTLLQSHEQSGEFLETPAAQLSHVVAHHASHDVSHDISHDEDPGEYPQGYRIGPYQFVRCLGRGGMGAVWLATRFDKEYQKQVAIKMVKRGMDSQEILRRFRTERQVLANLDHPNIARLIDGGSTPEGLPYLVMEYVEGTPIDQYCEMRKCSISERLHLFRAVCEAVHYAHQNLVVHRDIKTGNILVADGIPKLLDFGIAKLLSHDGTLDLAQTRPEMRPMTLDYASPEQVRGEPITTATDVYSLGVLLFRLLTEKMPYGANVRSQAALQNAICEKEPLRPSSLVLADDSTAVPEATNKLDAVSESREKARKRLRKKLSGDLDNIILMALRKEPHRRYLSVEQFSEDIERYLEGRPVIARLDTPGYQFVKFVRRNAEGVAAAVVIGVALISIAVVSQYNANLATAARERTEHSLQQTRHELVAAYLHGADAERAYVAAQSAYSVAPGDPLARRDLAEASLAMARRREAAGLASESLPLYQDALTQLEALALTNPQDFDTQRDLIVVANSLGAAQLAAGDSSGALSSYTRALQIDEGLAALQGSRVTASARAQIAAANRRLGELLVSSGAKDAGLQKLRKALEIYRELPASSNAAEISRQLEQP